MEGAGCHRYWRVGYEIVINFFPFNDFINALAMIILRLSGFILLVAEKFQLTLMAMM